MCAAKWSKRCWDEELRVGRAISSVVHFEGAAAIESALMVYAYAIEHLGFQASHFDVRKGNERVWRFHERFGAVRVAASDLDYFYQIAREKILLARTRYKKYLPESVEVEQQYEH